VLKLVILSALVKLACFKILVSFMFELWKKIRNKYRKTKRKHRGHIQLSGKNYPIAAMLL